MYHTNSCIEHLFFSFRLLFLSTRFLCILACLSLEFTVAFHLGFGFHLVSGFLVFLLFQMLRMLVTMNKCSLRKTINLSKILVMSCAVYKTEFTLWKAFITFTWPFVCPLDSVIIIFSKAHGISCFYTQKFRLDNVLEITNALDIEDFLISKKNLIL